MDGPATEIDPPLTAQEWSNWWETLPWLYRRLPANAIQSANAFAWIWQRCRGKVTAALRIYLPDLAERFAKTVENAQYYLNYLEGKEFLYVRNRRLSRRRSCRGIVPADWVILDVFHPNPEVLVPPFRVDPQRTFWVMEGAEAEERASPFEAHAPNFGLSCRSPSGASIEVPSGPSGKSQFRPCRDAVLGGVESGQLSTSEGFALISEPPSDGGSSRARAPVRSRSRLKSKSKSEISRAPAHARTPHTDQEGGDEQSWTYRIIQELGDPEIQAAPVRKVARKLAEGVLDWEVVQAIIDQARWLFRRGETPAPWCYTVGTFRKMFEERGWPWRRHKRKASGR